MKDTGIVASSERLLLRYLDVSDVGAAYEVWMNDPYVTRFLESRFVPHTQKDLRGFVHNMQENPSNHLLAVILRQIDRHVGNLKIGPVDSHHGTANIGILIGERDCWGRGIASEAIGLACGFAFGPLDLRKLTAGVYSNNHASIRAFEKAGFMREGVQKAQYISGGVPVDGILLGKLRKKGEPHG